MMKECYGYTWHRLDAGAHETLLDFLALFILNLRFCSSLSLRNQKENEKQIESEKSCSKILIRWSKSENKKEEKIDPSENYFLLFFFFFAPFLCASGFRSLSASNWWAELIKKRGWWESDIVKTLEGGEMGSVTFIFCYVTFGDRVKISVHFFFS